MKSGNSIFLPIIILIFSAILLYPNFATKELELVVNKELSALQVQEQNELLQKFIANWSKYNANKSWTITPDPAAGLPSDGKFVVKGRFITSADVNRISQENERLFIESKNKFKPLYIEELLKKGKPLVIKLGLDLQGGMRVVLKGDFENYSNRLKELYSKEINDLQKVISSDKSSTAEKREAQKRLTEIESNFELTEQRKLDELEKAKLIIDNRLANQNLTEPQVRIQKEQDAVEVSLPGVANSSEILEILQNTETVEYRLEEPDSELAFIKKINQTENALLDAGKREETDIFQFQQIIKKREGKKAEKEYLEKMEIKYGIPAEKYKLFAIWERGATQESEFLPRRFVVLEKSIVLSGNDLTNASPYFNSNNYGWAVSFTLTPAGAEKFFEVTSSHRGRNLAIIWGDKVVSDPRINDPIAGGRAEISGNFSREQAVQLSNVISEGALPVPLKILEMRFIGPTLGQESIKVGLKSVAIGFILVMIYMIFYYKLAGFIADMALMMNLVILTALLTLVDFTLTLPGFAGIVLTVGMAVDANVIIYERIREEIQDGKSIVNAIEIGFENAFWTIMDSNITTLIAAILMIKLGNGPIKGFAITLSWGIVTSMFTSLFVSRLILNLLVNKFNITKLNVGFNVYKGIVTK